MIGAVDEQHVGITQRLRGRQASETTPDDDDLFVRHEREPKTDYGSEKNVPTGAWGRRIRQRPDTSRRKTGAAVISALAHRLDLTLA